MSGFPEWSPILGAAVVIGLVESVWRIRRIRRQFSDHHVARFFGWPIDDTGQPTRVYWLEGVTRADVENALYGYTDRRWGWLCRSRVRKALVIANPVSWALTIYGATNLPLNLSIGDSALSWWALTPIPLWLAVRRSVRLIADAPAEFLDERLLALRDRTYVGSYRALSSGVGFVAMLIVVFNGFFIDLSDHARESQVRLMTASAYVLLWAMPALPSVLLAWTLRNEHPAHDH